MVLVFSMLIFSCVTLISSFASVASIFVQTENQESVESIAFYHLVRFVFTRYNSCARATLVTLKKDAWFLCQYIRYDWLLVGDNQKKVNKFL